MRFRFAAAAVSAASTLCVVMTAAPASAASSNVAQWEMDEYAGASEAFDSSGNGLHGRIGDDVQTGVSFGKARGYRFPYISGSSPLNLQHIVEVPENPSLDPGLSKYTVQLRFRSTQSWGNLVQKGQAGMTGGFWKVDISSGILTCLFRDENGIQSAASSRTPLNDGAWHRIRCTRTTNSVVLYVDGQWRDTRSKVTGVVDNGAPLTIAGKRYCGSGVQCDYWFGDMDFVRISSG
jgi:hypothetical protein